MQSQQEAAKYAEVLLALHVAALTAEQEGGSLICKAVALCGARGRKGLADSRPAAVSMGVDLDTAADRKAAEAKRTPRAPDGGGWRLVG